MRAFGKIFAVWGLICLVAVGPTAVRAHGHGQIMPPVLAERLITLLEDGRNAGVFQAELPEGCTPEGCLAALIAQLGPEDMEWLQTAPEAEIPSSHFGRLPPSMIVSFLRDLAGVLHDVSHHGADNVQGQRLIRMLLEWSE